MSIQVSNEPLLGQVEEEKVNDLHSTLQAVEACLSALGSLTNKARAKALAMVCANFGFLTETIVSVKSTAARQGPAFSSAAPTSKVTEMKKKPKASQSAEMKRLRLERDVAVKAVKAFDRSDKDGDVARATLKDVETSIKSLKISESAKKPKSEDEKQ